tara:strand:- start:637 stop:768 length:132 start_codon:yes stop_codon:yes gene_type:complete
MFVLSFSFDVSPFNLFVALCSASFLFSKSDISFFCAKPMGCFL